MTLPLLLLGGSEICLAGKLANLSFRSFLEAHLPDKFVIFSPPQPTWNSQHLQSWIQAQGIRSNTPLQIIAFSAGVVGASGLIAHWSIRQMIAVDGWCVPLWHCPQVVRMSHDLVTHWNGILFGGGKKHFYADPFVSHLDLWRDPERVMGWDLSCAPKRISAREFIIQTISASPATLDR
jgi:hypothetical protein